MGVKPSDLGLDVFKHLLYRCWSRTLRHFKRWFVGSTSLAVARYAPCPVAIVRGRLRPVERILVAVDGSEGAGAALRFLSTFGLVSNTPVILMHVLPTPVRGLHGTRTIPDWTNASVVMTDAAAVFSDARRPIEHLVREGDPAREIVRSARNRDVDLVVLGARGLRTLGRLLLGSVSETVLHHVGRPVMIVRKRDEPLRDRATSLQMHGIVGHLERGGFGSNPAPEAQPTGEC
jgi:nucleotide-binding universal stress UspA family protein